MKDKIAAIDLGNLRGLGPFGLQDQASGKGIAPSLFNTFISGMIGLMTLIAFIWFTFNFITGAIGIISSGGDKGKIEAARAKITAGVIGLVITIAALFIVQFIGSLTGVGNIILNPTSILESLTPATK